MPMNKEITAIVTLTIKPDAAMNFPAALERRIERTRVSDGFRNIRVLIDPTDSTRLTMVERWESEEIFLAYSKWRTTTDPIDARRYYATPPQTSIWRDLTSVPDRRMGQDSASRPHLEKRLHGAVRCSCAFTALVCTTHMTVTLHGRHSHALAAESIDTVFSPCKRVRLGADMVLHRQHTQRT